MEVEEKHSDKQAVMLIQAAINDKRFAIVDSRIVCIQESLISISKEQRKCALEVINAQMVQQFAEETPIKDDVEVLLEKVKGKHGDKSPDGHSLAESSPPRLFTQSPLQQQNNNHNDDDDDDGDDWLMSVVKANGGGKRDGSDGDGNGSDGPRYTRQEQGADDRGEFLNNN